MKLKAFFTAFISILLLLSPLTVSGASAAEDEINIIAFSDFQAPDGNIQGAETLSKILKAIAADGLTKIDGVLVCGDYDVDSYGDGEQTKAGIDTIKTQFSLVTSEENMLFLQGNHDTGIGTFGMCESGSHDFEDYGVFAINEDDYMWYNENEAHIKQTAENLKAYLDEKVDAGYNKPIFVLSHLPLHYNTRTRDSGDGQYANYIFDVLNEAGEKGLNIIFLFGHNHSGGFDDYLGGAGIYLAKGDNILIAQGSKTEFKSFSLNFTYMNAGYVGYYNRMNVGANDTLSMSVFKIKGNQVTVMRYNEAGQCLLKAGGVTNAYKNETGYEPDTKLYASPQIINKSSDTQTQNSSETEDNKNTDIPKENNNTVFVISLVIAAVAVVVIAVVIIVIKKARHTKK